MAKLCFRYGTVASGKSLDLLKVNYNYEENGMTTLILTSKIDDRYGHDIVKSRTGVHKNAIGIDSKDNIYEIIEYKRSIMGKTINCVLVDEVQFFTPEHIYQLSEIVDKLGIPVICYGLRADYKNGIFKSSAVLMAIADELEEMKTICSHCGKKKATVSVKIVDGIVQSSGKQIEIGGNELYKPMCRSCYKSLVK